MQDGPLFKDDGKYINLNNATCKKLYWLLIRDKFKKPTSEAKWIEKNNYNFDSEIWQQVYYMPYKVCRSTIIQSFQAKIVHRIFPCKEKLFHWAIKESVLCDHCNENSVDDIPHYFVHCNTVTNFWLDIFKWWQNVTETYFYLEDYEILFGVLNFNEERILNILNFILITAKWFIFQCKKESKNIFFEIYLIYLKKLIEVEKYILFKNGKEEEFYLTWSLIYDNL